MKQKEKLPVAKESIRSRTLIYFIVMALAMITLLWVVQEWFLSTQYSKMKQAEIVKIMNKATEEYSGAASSPDFFIRLHKTAIEYDMTVYFFAYKKNDAAAGCEKYTEDGEEYLRITGDAFFSEYILSAATQPGDFSEVLNSIYKEKDPKVNDLDWSKQQETRFIKLLKLDESFSPRKEPAFEYNEQAKWLYYASEAKEYEFRGEITHYYFYAEAVLSESGVTLELIRFEFILLTVLILLLSVAFSFLMSALISSPIVKMSKRAESFAKGNFDIRFGRGKVKEINSLAATLDFAAEEIGKTENLRREFIANISHDLRTPLTMIRAYAEMIRDISGGNPEKRNQHAQVIADEAQRLSSLVEDIQKLSKIQAGTDEVAPAPFDLDEFCSSTLGRFEIMREKFGYTLVYESGGKNIVVADRDKISQVLYNLIGNALNYAGKENKTVTVRQFRRGKSAIVEVEDNGKGIAEDELDAVWDRYYRVNQEKRSVVGSGLGLSIVKNILIAHKAEFGIKSEVGKGTIFWFALPAENIK